MAWITTEVKKNTRSGNTRYLYTAVTIHCAHGENYSFALTPENCGWTTYLSSVKPDYTSSKSADQDTTFTRFNRRDGTTISNLSSPIEVVAGTNYTSSGNWDYNITWHSKIGDKDYTGSFYARCYLYISVVFTDYALAYNANGATISGSRPSVVTKGEAITLPNISYSKESTGSTTQSPYKFTSFGYTYTWKVGNSTVGVPGGRYTPTADTTFVASYDESVSVTYGYRVKFDVNKGVGTIDDVTFTSGKDVEEGKSITSPTVPTREGYAFKGWSKSSTASVLSAGYTFDFSYGETTLYAVWQKLVDDIGISLSVSGNKATIVTTVSPADAYNTNVSVIPRSTSVISYANGVITPKNAGIVVFDVQSEDGAVSKTATVYITGLKYSKIGTVIRTDYQFGLDEAVKTFELESTTDTDTYLFLGWSNQEYVPADNLENGFEYVVYNSQDVTAGTLKTVYAVMGRYTHRIQYNANAPSGFTIPITLTPIEWKNKLREDTFDLANIASPTCGNTTYYPYTVAYAFVRWQNTKPTVRTIDEDNYNLPQPEIIKVGPNPVTVYALWARYRHTCDYVVIWPNTEPAIVDQSYYYDGVRDRCSFDISRPLGDEETRTFNGWADSAGRVYSGKTDFSTRTVKLYATWDDIYTLTIYTLDKITVATHSEFEYTYKSETVRLTKGSGYTHTIELQSWNNRSTPYGEYSNADSEFPYTKTYYSLTPTGWETSDSDVVIDEHQGIYEITISGNTTIRAQYSTQCKRNYGYRVTLNNNTAYQVVNPQTNELETYYGGNIPSETQNLYESGWIDGATPVPTYPFKLPLHSGWDAHAHKGWLTYSYTPDYDEADVIAANSMVALTRGEGNVFSAIWWAVASIRYLANNTTLKSESKDVRIGSEETFDVIADIPVYIGYEFKGWGRSPETVEYNHPSNQKWGGSSIARVRAEQELVLQPVWAPLYTKYVTYHWTNEESSVVSIEDTTTSCEFKLGYAKDKVTRLVQPGSRVGNYLFVTWSLHRTDRDVVLADGSLRVVKYSDTAANGLHLYAVYRAAYRVSLKYSDSNIVRFDPVWGEEFLPIEYGTRKDTPVAETKAVLADTAETVRNSVFERWELSDGRSFMLGAEVDVSFYSLNHTDLELGVTAKYTNKCKIFLVLGVPIIKNGVYEYQEEMSEVSYQDESFGVQLTKTNLHNLLERVMPDDANRYWLNKVYKGTTYTPNAQSYYDSQTDSFTFTPSSEDGVAIITLYLEFKPATYTIRVYPGSNTVAEQSYYDYQRTYTLEKDHLDTLTLDDFIPIEEMDTITNGGQYTLRGYSYALEGDVIYPASVAPEYNAFRFPNGAYPKEGQRVDFYAQWGENITGFTCAGTEKEDRAVTWRFLAQPVSAADPTVAIFTCTKDGRTIYDATTNSTYPTQFTVESTISRNSTVLKVTFNDPGKYAFSFRPKTRMSDPIQYDATVAYSRLRFENDAGAETLSMVLPDQLDFISTDNSDVPYSIPLADSNGRPIYTAICNRDYLFSGWSDSDRGTSAIDTISLVQGGDVELYPLWEQRYTYILNGGYWEDPVEDIVCTTTYTQMDKAESVTLTSVEPLHNTKEFNGWSSETLFDGKVARSFGVTLIVAQWKLKSLEWVWGRAGTIARGPYTTVDMGTKGVEEYSLMTYSFTWTEPPVNLIEFNTSENMPSHVNGISFPDSEVGTIQLALKHNPEVIIWSKSFIRTGDVKVSEEELPHTLRDSVGNLYVGNIYSSVDANASRITPVNGEYTFTVDSGEVNTLYLDTSGTEDKTSLKIISDMGSGVFPIDISFDQTYGNWIRISNKYSHRIPLGITEKIYSAETYELDQDDYGTYFFRRIYENWLTASKEQTGRTYVENEGEWSTETIFGSILTSVRANAGYYAAVYTTYPDKKLVNGKYVYPEKKYVMLVQIVDESPDAPICKLTKYESADAPPEVFYLSSPDQPNISITSVTKSMKAQLTQSPILTKNSQFNYIIDLGNTETLSFTVSRTPPTTVNDLPNGNPTYWSNKYWLTRLKEYFDQWQNANYDHKHRRAGGYNLVFDPVVENRGFPKIDKNVFLSSALSYTYDRAVIDVSFRFTVASMLGREAATISDSAGEVFFDYDDELGAPRTISVKYYNSMYIVPDLPADASGYIGWMGEITDKDGRKVQRLVYPGQEIGANTQYTANGAHFVGYKGILKKVLVCPEPVNNMHLTLNDLGVQIPSQGRIWIHCTAVGGGGGGGTSQADVFAYLPDVTDTDKPIFYVSNYYIGGGGGSGYTVSRTVQMVNQDSIIAITVGEGGPSDTDGGNTILTIGGTRVVNAAGGTGGQLKSNGAGGNKGGEHTSATNLIVPMRWGKGNIKGSNGYPDPNVATTSLLVRGGSGCADPDYGDSSTRKHVPSSGGGSALLRRDYEGVDVLYMSSAGAISATTTKYFESVGATMVGDTVRPIGASGGNVKMNISKGDARYGGGGCSLLNSLSLDNLHFDFKIPSSSDIVGNALQGFKNFLGAIGKAKDGKWGEAYNTLTGYEQESKISINDKGTSGAAGVMILEFYEDTFNGRSVQ